LHNIIFPSHPEKAEKINEIKKYNNKKMKYTTFMNNEIKIIKIV
jgi:hypothetical protein